MAVAISSKSSDFTRRTMFSRATSNGRPRLTSRMTRPNSVVTGGRPSRTPSSIAFTIRERIRIKGEIRTLTAQQRLSGYVVAGLPIGLAGILFIIAPQFFAPMFDKPPDLLGIPLGVILLGLGGFAMFVGFQVIRKVVDIEV
jgi:tight adherence protein B